MEKKSNKGLVIFLIIFILISLALGGYIVYDKYFNNVNEEKKTEKKEVKEDVQEEKLNLESSIVQELYNDIKSTSNFDQELIEQALNKEKVLVSDLSSEILNFYGYRNLHIHLIKQDLCRNYPSVVNNSYYDCGNGIEKDETENATYTFEEKDLKNSVENLFGLGKYQQTESFEINYAQYFVYDKDSQKYVYATIPGGGTSPEYEKELIDLKQSADTLSLIEKISFEDKELAQISYDYKQDNDNYYLYAINLLSKQE